MAPTKFALVGLAANDSPQVGVGNWGIHAHLNPILASPNYELVAVCNSSVESAQKSIKFHKLDPSIKAYGSTAELAKDTEVELVAVSINVVKHYEATRHLIEGGKDVLVEWPLGRNLQEAEELTKLAKQKGVKNYVGLQLRADPLLKKLKQLVNEGVLGEIRSSVANISSSILPANIWMAGAEYYIDFDTGGNELTIFTGHCKYHCGLSTRSLTTTVLDAFVHILGDFGTTNAILINNHPSVPLLSMTTGEIVNPAAPKNTPDHIFINGRLQSGAAASITVRKTTKPVDDLGLRWLISGTKGEIEVTMPEDHIQQAPAGRKIRLRREKEEAEVFEFGNVEEPEHIKKVSQTGVNTARLYENVANGKEGVADFEQATNLHRLLETVIKESGYKW